MPPLHCTTQEMTNNVYYLPCPFHCTTQEMTQARCKELAGTSSFHRLVYSEIEDAGWEHLVKLSDDLSFLSFRILDKKERVHVIEVHLDKSYPCIPPSVAANVPYLFDLKWSATSALKDVLRQFSEHLQRLQELWDVLDNIDKCLPIEGPKQPCYATCYRQISIGNDCSLILHLDASDPKTIPECRFVGSDSLVNSLRQKWRTNGKKWSKDKTTTENLLSVLETRLPEPLDAERNSQILECGICYAAFLPTDEEAGAKRGSKTDYTCENANCGRAFHSACLGDWLQSITTTRRSYGVLFGTCPYCSEPVAVGINAKIE
ncbi:hypothetical protein Dimus_013873 [Dionaea muscipula]